MSFVASVDIGAVPFVSVLPAFGGLATDTVPSFPPSSMPIQSHHERDGCDHQHKSSFDFEGLADQLRRYLRRIGVPAPDNPLAAPISRPLVL